MEKDFKLASGLTMVGNIIDNCWYKHLTISRGKETIPHSNAILILSEIVYWYRPIEIQTEDGKIIYKKKFKYDLLQKSYSDFCEKFGFTKNQVRTAMDYLEKKGLIIKQFRNLTIKGTRLSNVLFIGLNVENLLKISSKPKQAMSKPKKVKTKPEPTKIEKKEVTDSNSRGIALQSDTYTKTTAKTKEKESNLVDSTTNKYSEADLDLILKQAQLYTYSNKPELKSSIESIIIELYTRPNISNTLRIGLSDTAIRLILKNLRLYHIDAAIDLCIKYNAKNKIYFMKTLITVIQELGIDDFVGSNQDNECGKVVIPKAIRLSNVDNFEQRKYNPQEYTDLENDSIVKMQV